jgi:DNA-directed RNA polymerase subunit RPC12/RpoP
MKKRKKRKVYDAVEGGYTRVWVQDGGGTPAAAVEVWECATCKKRLGTEQGARTHVYMVHVLAEGATSIRDNENSNSNNHHNRDGGNFTTACTSSGAIGTACGADGAATIAVAATASTSASASVPVPSYTCEFCGKEVRNADALFQHQRAKHQGLYTSIKPSWAAASSTASADPTITAAATITSPSNIIGHAPIGDEAGTRANPDIVTITDTGPDIDTASEAVTETGMIVGEYELPSVNSSVVRAFPCSVCDVVLDSEDALRRHMEGWQPIRLEKSLICSHCGKKFADERGLKQHMNFCILKAGN